MTGSTARLLSLLLAAKDRNEPSQGGRWFALLGIDRSKKFLELQAFAEILLLPGRARDEIRSVLGDEPIYSRSIDRIEKVFVGAKLDRPWKDMEALYAHGNITDLEHTVHQLGKALPLAQPSEGDLLAILGEIDALREVIFGASIEVGLKTLLLGSLEEMRRAILLSRLRGAEGIAAEMDRCVGMLIHHGLVGQPVGSEKASVADRFMELVMKVYVVVDTAEKVQKVSAAIGRLLPSGATGGVAPG